MSRRNHKCAALVTLAMLTALSACKRKEEASLPPAEAPPAAVPSPSLEAVRVTDVDLGNAVGADKRVTAETDHFKPTETVYAVVSTEGTASGSPLTARWTFQDGQTVDETTQNITTSGPTLTEFHVSKPSGWPEGK